PGAPGHPLGTDALGRDVFSQLVYGTRTSLLVGYLAAALSLVVGILVGAVSGFVGGRLDATLMRITEAFQIMPPFLVALVIIALLGAGISKIIVVIGLLTWPPTARVVRGQFLSLREREFVAAARCVGVPMWRIMLAEILPNALPPAIAVVTLDVA